MPVVKYRPDNISITFDYLAFKDLALVSIFSASLMRFIRRKRPA